MTVLTPEALGRFSSWITRRMRQDDTPGLSLAIADRDGVLQTAAFGMADVAARSPVTPAHLFETG